MILPVSYRRPTRLLKFVHLACSLGARRKTETQPFVNPTYTGMDKVIALCVLES